MSEVAEAVSGLVVVEPRSPYLYLEKTLGHLLYLGLLVTIITLGLVLFDPAYCNEAKGNLREEIYSLIPPKEPVDNFIAVVCATDARIRGWLFFVEKFITFGAASGLIFANSYFMKKMNRYHAISLREKIPECVGPYPIWKNVDYIKRWNSMFRCLVAFKLLNLVLLGIMVVGGILILYLVPSVWAIIGFDGFECGPDMLVGKDIGIEQICHFEHEFAIFFLNICSNVIAVTSWLTFLGSLLSMIVYYRSFHKELKLQEQLNLTMITYIVGKEE